MTIEAILQLLNSIFRMMRDFTEVNNSLTQEMFQQARFRFQNNKKNQCLNPLPLSMLPLLLQSMKISIPQSMMKDYLKCMSQTKNPKMTFIQFTHYIARASLESQIQDELKNLFFIIDRQQTGTINAQDLWLFVKDLQGGDVLNQRDIDNLMVQLDRKQMGFLSYQDFVYGLLPQ